METSEESLCKIESLNSIGFLASIKNEETEHKFLIALSHDKEPQPLKNELEFTLMNGETNKLSLTNHFTKIINFYEKYVYVIKILKEDNLDLLKFIEIDLDDCNKHKNESIFVLFYNEMSNEDFIMGRIKNIENKQMEISHNIIRVEEKGIAGSPVILKSNSKVIGIHCGAEWTDSFSKCLLISEIFKELSLDN